MSSASSSDTVTLAAHSWALVLRPAIGGAVAALRWQGHDVLRPSPPAFSSPLDSACFPLIPYANRIADGRFTFAGTRYQVPRNFGDHPHSLHGTGWQSVWTAESPSEAAVRLAHSHSGDTAWPWSYHAEQQFTLAGATFAAALTVTNTSPTAMPAGLGFHPYFPCTGSTRLTAHATCLYLADDNMLPTAPAPAGLFGDWSRGAPVAGNSLIDNAYDGWDGTARIALGDVMLSLEASGAPAFHLYRPPGADFFCFEPISHLPDAINRGGMPLLGPGDSLKLEMRLTARLNAGG